MLLVKHVQLTEHKLTAFLSPVSLIQVVFFLFIYLFFYVICQQFDVFVF